MPVADAGDSGGLVLPPPGPPPDDAGDLCGRLHIPIVVERPNLYFVLDASGSMNSPMDKSNGGGVIPSRYDAARAAIRQLLLSVGHRVNYGAALFPPIDSSSPMDICPIGDEEVFPVQPGDPYDPTDQVGPVLAHLVEILRKRAPSGLTPTAATLRHLEQRILGLPGKTFVFLLTDGAPNCNAAAGCSATECTINVDGACDPNNPALNCCNPTQGGLGYVYCIDADPTLAAVADLDKKHAPTFVIGMPGTGQPAYRDLLDRLAQAGGTSRTTEPYYYPVESADDLAQTLQTIGLSVSISCEVKLSTRPPDPKLVNVYFDKRVVKFDANNGWTWASLDGGVPVDARAPSDAAGDGDAGPPARIEIVGDACNELKRGDVIELQVVAGCPSVVK